MRDLKRSNAKLPAYKFLEENRFDVFTPMKWALVEEHGKKIRKRIPVLPDLLFVRSTRSALDEIVDKLPTLQYRYLRGGYCRPMIVPDADMDLFLRAVSRTEDPCYYLPGEITPGMYGRTVRIVGGGMDGLEGKLLTVRGSKRRRLVVSIPSVLEVTVEITPDFVQMQPI
ncbi:UpxY family transcription antiterminator [uncultured Alistipes sp.]|uniref:UpxY family transcription antiterminator n=1 Tax=uncultured Alistipes sp. TaxID=538949 RepID=UPI00261B56C0|nr:UpxY family transcription antiterminator [uncultured Alistipes sp.]